MTTEIILEITPAQARKELARRNARKGTAKRRAYPATHIFQASGATLEAIAATPEQAPVTTPVPAAAPVVVNPHVELRKQAWAMRMEAREAGEKLTYAEACTLLGTYPARKAA
jgi:hypothetical protein